MTCRTGRAAPGRGVLIGRTLAVLAGLWAGLGWVPADGVSGRLAVLVGVVALVVVLTGRWPPARPPQRRAGLDAVSTLALLLVVVAAAAAALTPPDLG